MLSLRIPRYIWRRLRKFLILIRRISGNLLRIVSQLRLEKSLYNGITLNNAYNLNGD